MKTVNLAEILTLDRPLAVVDLETTGFNLETDRVFQIGVSLHLPDRQPMRTEQLVNPEIPIPPDIVELTGVTNEMVVDKPKWKDTGPKVASALTDVDIAGYYIEFDVGFLRAEMKRASIEWVWQGHLVDALAIYRLLKPHSLQNAYKEYVDPEGFTGAHQAGTDVAATEMTLEGQLVKHPHIPRTVRELSEYCFPNRVSGDLSGKLTWIKGEACLSFGKYRGVALRKVERGYLEWCLTGSFPDDFKLILARALKGEYPVKAMERGSGGAPVA